MEFFILVVSPLVLPAVFFRRPLKHCPWIWLGMAISLCGGTIAAFRAEPYPISVLMYLCQLPYSWSFYYMFFVRGHHSDSLCVIIGLCMSNFVMLMQYFTIDEFAGWFTVPYIVGLWCHMIWNLHCAFRVAEPECATSSTVCGAQPVLSAVLMPDSKAPPPV